MSRHNLGEKNMHEEHKEEIKMLKDSIKHYEEVLKKPPFKWIFGEEDSHVMARRIIKKDKKELNELEKLYA